MYRSFDKFSFISRNEPNSKSVSFSYPYFKLNLSTYSLTPPLLSFFIIINAMVTFISGGIQLLLQIAFQRNTYWKWHFIFLTDVYIILERTFYIFHWCFALLGSVLLQGLWTNTSSRFVEFLSDVLWYWKAKCFTFRISIKS